MTVEFSRDDDWQRRMASRFLDPFYARRGWRVLRYPGDHAQQKRHVDVLLTRHGEQRTIDEKIIRGRRDGHPATKISFETMSCTVPGEERPGWGARYEENDSTHLFICFADRPDLDKDCWTRVAELDCLWIPFPALRDWFWRVDGGRRFERQPNGQDNGSISHKVPIAEILAEFPEASRFILYADGAAHRISTQARLVS